MIFYFIPYCFCVWRLPLKATSESIMRRSISYEWITSSSFSTAKNKAHGIKTFRDGRRMQDLTLMDCPQRLQGKQLRAGVLQPELLSLLFVCARVMTPLHR